MKRRLAILFVAVVLLLVAASLALLRTRWAGDRLCAEVARRVRAATGEALEVDSCRVEPLLLAVEATGVRVGPARAPLFQADRVRVRLAPVQTMGGAPELAELQVQRPRLSASLPPGDSRRSPLACPPPLLARLRIQRLQVEDGQLDLRFPGGSRLRVARLRVQASPPAGPGGLRALASPAGRTVLSVAVEEVELDGPGRTTRLEAAQADAELALDLSSLELRQAWAASQGARLEARGSVARLCDPTLDLKLGLKGPLRAILQLASGGDVPSSGTAALEARITGRPADPVVEGSFELGAAKIGSYQPGDVKGRVRLQGRELQVPRLEVALPGGGLTAKGLLRLGKQVALEGEAHLDGAELGDVLARFGLRGAWVSMRVKGDLKASGTAWPLQLAGNAALELADFRVLDHAWDRQRPGERTILDFRRGKLDAKVRATAEGVALEDVHLRVGAEELTARAMLHFEQARGFSVELAGGADLSELRHVASVSMLGRAVLVGRLQAAPYGNPRVEVSARVRDFRFLDLDLGEAGAEVTYGDGGGFVLQARHLEGRRGETRYTGTLQVDLGRAPDLSGAFEARGRLRDLFEGAMPWLPAAEVARDALDAKAQVEATLEGPATALGATFTARLGPGQFLRRPFDSGLVAGRIEAGRRAVFDRAELFRASGSARGTGWVGLGTPFPWEIEGSAAGIPLEGLLLPGGRWEGSVGGEAHLAGSFEAPQLRFAVTGVGVQVAGVPVGSIQVGGKLRQGVLAVIASTEGVNLSGEARTSEGMPFEARAEIDVEDVTRFFPRGPPAGLRARARGEARAQGLLSDPAAAAAELSLTELLLGYGDFKVQNRDRVVVATAGGRVELRAFSLVGTNTEFSLTGARERDGRLSLLAEGSLDLRLLGGFLPGLTRTHGKLAVEAHVSGTAADPLLVGSGRLRDAGFQFRDLPVTVGAMSGELAFSQNRVIFDHLPATVNGGGADLAGEVELSRFVPARVRASARLDEVPLRIPSTLPSVVSGQLAVAGNWDSMLLSGKLEVIRALYTERVDLEKNLLEVRRRVSAPRVFDRSGEWLRLDVALILGGDLRVENDLVRGGVRGELNLTGTLAGFGLVGSVAMTPGSRATFRGNEFLLTHAVADLTDRRRIRAQLDVHGETQARDYQVFMHLFGPFDDPQLQLTSVPSLTQEDLITLLSIGITSRDAAAGGGVYGAATAAAAQALFSASGLDEQVKRFLPRAGPIRDFTLRITSAYSEGAGQVVPRAEFESKLGERLRLRYQAPISGVAKGGQRAQLELKLGGRASLQYQWDTDNPDVSSGGDHGLDLRFRWEWSD